MNTPPLSSLPRAAVIRLEGVSVRAGSRTLLQVPALAIEAGERVAIVGPNGAGKSTLLRVLTGMAGATQGRVHVLGRELGALPKNATGSSPLSPAEWRGLRREVGLVMQGLHLVPRLSARENVLIGALARLRGADAWRSWLRLYPATLVAEADAALASLGLAVHAGTRSDRLSGGERQKVSLARLRLQHAPLVLADEPTAALDPAATRQVCAALRQATDAPGRTLVSVLHDLDLLPVLATRVLGMGHGRVLWDLPLGDVDAAALQALYAPDDADAARGATSRSAPSARADYANARGTQRTTA